MCRRFIGELYKLKVLTVSNLYALCDRFIGELYKLKVLTVSNLYALCHRFIGELYKLKVLTVSNLYALCDRFIGELYKLKVLTVSNLYALCDRFIGELYKLKVLTVSNLYALCHRFIGELYKLKVLTEKIMHDCLMKLLRSNDEEDMECLCRLLTTIGKDIDHDKAKTEVDQYFQQIHNLIKAHCTSARVRFMLQDVVELRRSKWVPRRDDNAPKTIDQIHQEAQAQQVQQKLAMSQQKVVDLPRPTRGSGSRGGEWGGR